MKSTPHFFLTHLVRTSWIAIVVLFLICAGCQRELMPTPNLYTSPTTNPFADVPPALQKNYVDVLYFTDRQPENNDPAHPIYGYKRSRSAAFGLSEVHIGKDLTWDKLVQESRTQTRDVELDLSVSNTRELGRLAPTPPTLLDLSAVTAASQDATIINAAAATQTASADDAFRQTLSAQLALTPVKDVYIFVHGFSVNFDNSLITIGELWHFLGRQGVPIAYSWPAGSKGALAYLYDRESSEFTVYHLKQMLRLIASCPDVRRVHIIGHSRGTDVVLSAIRELLLEIRGSGKKTSDELKLATVVLAAPDLDFDVIVQRMAADRVGQAAEHSTLYVCSQDKALSLSNWLFSGIMRLGQLHSHIFSSQELNALRTSKQYEVVDARVSDAGSFGHNYFYASPAVSSDLILLLRYNDLPGADHGRPLKIEKDGFWQVYDGYPQPPKNAPNETPGK